MPLCSCCSCAMLSSPVHCSGGGPAVPAAVLQSLWWNCAPAAPEEEGCSQNSPLKQIQIKILDKDVCPALFRNAFIIFPCHMLGVSKFLTVISAPRCMIPGNESRWKFEGCNRSVAASSTSIQDRIMKHKNTSSLQCSLFIGKG